MINQNLLLTGDDGYNLTNSLRFRSSASAYLNRTPATSSNRKTWTWSGWVKRGTLGVSQYFFSGGTGGSDTTQFGINFLADNKLNWLGGSGTQYRTTTQVFRDPAAWYHIVLAFDTTLATANDRIKIYVNGTQITAFDNLTNPTQNVDYGVNQAEAHNIGRWTGASGYFDGYLAEINFIDGQALTPSSFGETSATTGVWIPKKYSGTYGTNGFYLPFTDNSALTTSSNVGLGKDFSGNANYWTTNNISITSGSTYDSMTDVPTLTSATAANYAVINPLDYNATYLTLSAANLQQTYAGVVAAAASRATMVIPTTGKYYWEVYINATGGGSGERIRVGITRPTTDISGNSIDNSATSYLQMSNGQKRNNSTDSTYGAGFSATQIIQVLYDATAGSIYFGQNDSYANGSGSFNQTFSTATAAFTGLSGEFMPCFITYGGADIAVNFGQRPFAYTPPTGFNRLNTFNLPTPTIGATASTTANKYFDATLWTGDGNTRSITGIGFAPDLIVGKSRSNAFIPNWWDSVRGTGKVLASDRTDSEAGLGTAGGTISAFNSDGWTMQTGTSNFSWLNQTSATYVGWLWKANGAGSTNTAGTITSTVSANTSAGFSIVTYTGTGSNATVGHGLGVAPSMIICKNRIDGTTLWSVYNSSVGAASVAHLNSTAAFSASSDWNSTTPTSTVFSVGSSSRTNASTQGIVAYCFAPIAGYSAFGSYTGNGSTDGPFIFTGFRPRFLMTKKTNSTGGWGMVDTSINPYNQATTYLQANTSNAVVGGTSSNGMDMLSNGFKIRSTDASFNETNGDTYIYMAFCESPFKFSNAR